MCLTCLFLSSAIREICIFFLPIFLAGGVSAPAPMDCSCTWATITDLSELTILQENIKTQIYKYITVDQSRQYVMSGDILSKIQSLNTDNKHPLHNEKNIQKS